MKSPSSPSHPKQGAPTYDQGDLSPAAQRSRLRTDRNEPRPGPHLAADDDPAGQEMVADSQDPGDKRGA